MLSFRSFYRPSPRRTILFKHQSAHNLRERETPTSAYPNGYKNINTSSSSPSLLVNLHQKSRREAKRLHARYQTSKAADSLTRQSHAIIELLQRKDIADVPGPRIHRSTSTIQNFDSQNRGSCKGCLCACLRRAESYHSMSGPSDEALFSARSALLAHKVARKRPTHLICSTQGNQIHKGDCQT